MRVCISGRDGLVDGSHDTAGTGHFNRGFDRIFEIVRVIGRHLISIAEVHAIVARAHRAQGKPEMSRDRFGFLKGHGAVHWRFRFLVALPPERDVLLFAKHLFVAAMVVAIAPAGGQSYARQAFDNWCCRRNPWVAPSIPASTLGALLIPALPFVAPSSEVSLARIWGLGASRAGKFTVAVSILPQSSVDDDVDRYTA